MKVCAICGGACAGGASSGGKARIDEAGWLATPRALATHLAQGDTLELRRQWLTQIEIELGSGSSTLRTA